MNTPPMDPERLADLREGLDDNRGSERPVPHDLVCELLADRDRLAGEVKRQSDMLAQRPVVYLDPGAADS